MDAKGWVRHAIERLGWAGEREILRYLDEAGEELSRKELREALSALLAEGAIEQKGDLYRMKPRSGSRAAFDRLFKEASEEP